MMYWASDTVTANGKSFRTILLITLLAEEAEYQTKHKTKIFKGLLKPDYVKFNFITYIYGAHRANFETIDVKTKNLIFSGK